VVHGSWTNSPTAYTDQWLQCGALGGGCLPIPAATGSTYVPSASDVGHTLAVQESASNQGGVGGPATSRATETVLALAAPMSSLAPAITGQAQQGQTLNAQVGSWTNQPTSFAYQWQRCDSAGAVCSPVLAATAPSYTLGGADVGFTMRVAVSAANLGGTSAPAMSAQSAVVTPAATTFGKSGVGAFSDSFAAERKRVSRYPLNTAGSVGSLSIYLAPTATPGQQVLKGVIYADSSGAPGALLEATEQLTFASSSPAGRYEMGFPSPLKLAPGTYWIGVISGGASSVTGFRWNSVSGARALNSNSYSSGPSNPFGAATIDSEQMSVYATYRSG